MITKFEILLEKKDIDSSFIQAAKRGSSATIKKLIAQGEDINIRDKDGRTPLIYASLNRFLMIVDILIKAGADVNLRDLLGRTALMCASTEKIIDKLLDAGADVNIKNTEQRNIIMEYIDYAGMHPDIFIFRLNKFLKRGLDIYTEDYDGNTVYDLIKKRQGSIIRETDRLYQIEKYLDKNFPKLGEDWRFKNDVKQYNL
jgi:ankyrin repeat protein